MTGVALALVLVAAVVHAVWNLLAKKAGGGATFVWLYSTAATVFYAPLTAWALATVWHRLRGVDALFLATSGLLHLVYFVVLQRAYRTGDLSQVYPLARGTGPVLATAGAMALFGERPSWMAMVGAAAVAVSAYVFSAPTGGPARMAASIRLGLATGGLICCYTLWDAYAVAGRRIPPLLMEGATGLTRMVLLFPAALRDWAGTSTEWRGKRGLILWIGALNPLPYILVLTALTFSPVSYIAPAREVSILFAALFGAQILKEGNRSRRLAAAAVMVAGVILLALG